MVTSPQSFVKTFFEGKSVYYIPLLDILSVHFHINANSEWSCCKDPRIDRQTPVQLWHSSAIIQNKNIDWGGK